MADYVFTRDYLDNNRINLQHYLWIELFGYHIHPSIPSKGDHLRIADVGTGTGTWLTDLSTRLPPSTRLDGFDVSFGATPPAKWLPENMHLHQWDVKTPPDAEVTGVYDIVHIRNFAFVLLDDDAEPVLDNLRKLLKPGGYLQWAEPDVASFRIEKTDPSNPTDALQRLLKLSQGQDSRLSPQWVPRLPALFEKAGFERVESDVRDAPPPIALATHEDNLLIHELVVRKTQNQQVAEELKTLMSEVARETREGSCWAFTRWTVIGRRSLDA